MPASPSSSSPSDWDALKDLVADALDQPEAQRDAFIEHNATSPSIVAEARKLLAAQTRAGGVLHRRTDRFLGLSGPDTAALEGRNFDKYKLVRLLGEGGMAAVYLAHQVGVERPVALKILRPSALGYDAARRFAREVAAHGRIEHPNIARIYDAGVWKDPDLPGAAGVPYIAMEFVDGEPLNVFAKQQNLSLPDRLRLLADIADAVHAAHQRAIVHRDLKPGNILVKTDGEHGSPTILDFGIARVLQNVDEHDEQSTLADRARALQTTTGVLLGTLAYMAPEQARGDADLVDVRSDVYALGIMLHELVTGRLPVAVTNLPLTRALAQLSDPNVNATTIGTIADDQTGGDLRTVLTTALAAEPDRRYASAEALADDLRRMLRHEPIEARPPTRTYLMKKFVRRNRGVVVSASLVAATLVAASVVSSAGFVRERNSRRVADEQRNIADERRVEAETQRAEALADDLRRMLRHEPIE
ncbi:MAG: serine/threonine-protein kinase, partial [Planctomycetota bacterium]